MKTLPEKLRDLMHRHRTNPTQLEQLDIGIKKNTIHRWLKGQRRPTADQIEGLARVLHVSVAYLLDDTIDEPGDVGGAAALPPGEQRCLGMCRQLGVERAAYVLETVLNLTLPVAVSRLLGNAAPGDVAKR